MISEISEVAKPVRIPPEYIHYADKHSIFDLIQKKILMMVTDFFIIVQVPSIFMFGPRHVGKKNLARMLKGKLQCVVLNGEEIYNLCTNGRNASPQELTAALKKRLKEPDCESKGYIIVDFPRFESEAKALRREGIFPEYAIFLEAPLPSLIETVSAKRIDPETGDLYNLIYNPPLDPLVERRLQKLPGNKEDVRKEYDDYKREVVLLKNIYSSVAYEFNADQPTTDVYSSVLGKINQRHRSIALKTPRIILLGYPGAGKKTQATLLAKKYGLISVDCGHLVLQEIANQSSIGNIMKTYVYKGLPVPDAIISEAVKNRLNQIDCVTYGWILYGYPRTRQQAELLSSNQLAPNRVILLDIHQSCASERLSGRRVDPVTGTRFHTLFQPVEDAAINQRALQHPKDRECTIGAKLARFTAHRDDLIDYYDSCVIRVHADRDVHTVFEEIEAAIDQIEIQIRKPDPVLVKYARIHHLYEIFEALLCGLSVMLPENPHSWIAEKLQLLYEIGYINLNWDTFIDPDMKPSHPYVDHELMNSLFGTEKLEFISPEELQYQPTPEMIGKAYAAHKQSILKKCFSAWKLYFIIKRARTTYMYKINYIAERSWKIRRLKIIFHAWQDFAHFVKNKQNMAQSLIAHIKESTMAMLYFKAWRKTVAEARKTRDYFSKMLTDSQDLGEKSDSESEDQFLSLGGKLNDSENYRDRLAEMPHTVQYKIFEYLTPIDLARAACVSRYWMSMVNDMDRRNRLDLSCFRERLPDEILIKLTRKRRAYLRHINLRGTHLPSMNSFRGLVSCANLQDINLTKCTGITNDAVRLISKECSLLLYLNLSYTEVTDDAVRHLATNTKMLQYLSLAYCTRLTEVCSTYFNQLECFKSLKYLDLSGCVPIGSSGLQTIIKSVKHVENWLLNDIPWISDSDLIVLGSNCPTIQTIEMVNNQNVIISDAKLAPKLYNHPEKSAPVSAIATSKTKQSRPITCTGLISKSYEIPQRNSTIYSGGLITDQGLESICSKNLKRFMISNQNLCDGSGLHALGSSDISSRRHSSCKSNRTSSRSSKLFENGSANLQRLSVIDCPKMSDFLLQYLVLLKHLTILNLTGCENLTDYGIKLLADGEYASCLRELYLTRCIKLTDKAIHSMSGRLPNLAYLSLASCPLITDAAFELLCQFQQLWQINLNSTKIGDRGLSALGSLPKLRELKVSKCTAITDLGLQKFAHLGINLEYIDLSFCHNLTNNGIKTLAFCCRYLVSLSLAGCIQVY
ncbi:unnamed protein product [Trichobilharzia szidati]|nr:unnamed protein product [Trichobilharzia szidati]